MFACLNTHLNRFDGQAREISILDAGCGDGKLILFLREVLPGLYPNIKFIFLGFDVNDHGVQEKGFLSNSIKNLADKFPEDDWRAQISIIGSEDNWVYPDSSIDFVISNQVLEHVKDLQHFLSEVGRVLKDGGVSVHLFPIGHNLVEPHIRIPFVHWMRSWDLMYSYIKAYVRTGLGRYDGASDGVAKYAEQHADYLLYNTRYRTEKELYEVCKACDLRASFRFSTEFYSGKVRSLLRLKSKALYQMSGRSIFDAVAIKFLRYVSDVTLCVEKRNTYQR
jgi:SAM-dependent methyltransferase